MVLPSWPMRRSSPSRTGSHPSPHESPRSKAPGSPTCSCCMQAIAASPRPGAVDTNPPRRCIAANSSRSRTGAVISPAGPDDKENPPLRGRPEHSVVAALVPERGIPEQASSGSVPVRVRPSGVMIRSRNTVSHTCPVTFSMTRPNSQSRTSGMRERLAERVQLAGVGEHLDILREHVVAAAGVGEDVAVDSAGVGEQVPHGHQGRDRLVAKSQLRQHIPDGRVEIEPPARPTAWPASPSTPW